MATMLVKLFVFMMGFGSCGARRYSMAAEMIKQCHGHIPPNSMLATYQSIGAGGLGWRRFTKIFLADRPDERSGQRGRAAIADLD